MEQTMCIYNRSLRYKNKVKEIKFKYKSVTMINHVTGWFEITQYDEKKVISIISLIKTMWLTRYTKPTEITYDQGS